MRNSMFHRVGLVTGALSLVLASLIFTSLANAQPMESPSTGKSTPVTTGAPTLSAELVDATKKAAQHTATVKVTTSGVSIVDPAASMEKPRQGEAHFHYRVDAGPTIATTAPKLSFHDLSSGAHTITINLAANDHSMLGKPVVLRITIP